MRFLCLALGTLALVSLVSALTKSESSFDTWQRLQNDYAKTARDGLSKDRRGSRCNGKNVAVRKEWYGSYHFLALVLIMTYMRRFMVTDFIVLFSFILRVVLLMTRNQSWWRLYLWGSRLAFGSNYAKNFPRGRLSNSERTEYVTAVLCLQAKPPLTLPSLVPGVRSRFDDFVAAHINQTLTIHFSVMILFFNA